MSAWKSRLRATGSLLKEMAGDWMEDNVLRLSAALAYYSIFSIAPLLVIAVGIAGEGCSDRTPCVGISTINCAA
ncbi:MAG: hypothetical protein M3436_12070 [Pseudomonadota bacterium]|nr:hypothetical protein [Pseudomonadota bacterium]